MAKTSYFAVAARSHGPPAVGARRWRSTRISGFRLRHRRPRKRAHIKLIRTDCALERSLSHRVSGAAQESRHGSRIDLIVRCRGEAMRIHIYSRRPRLVAVFLREGLGGHAIMTSRRSARRINSGKLTPSRRALSSRSCWTSRGSRNVTGTLPFGSFVLGMNDVYHCIIHYVNIEFSCPVIFAVTRSAACETRNPRQLRSPFLSLLTGPSRRWPIKNTAGISLPRSGKCFTRKPACRPSFACTKRRLTIP